MKTFPKPDDIAIKIQGRPVTRPDKTELTISLREFLSGLFETHQSNFSQARACGRIEAAVMAESPDVELLDEDHKFLMDVMNGATLPSLPLADGKSVAIGIQLVPFIEAVEAAK